MRSEMVLPALPAAGMEIMVANLTRALVRRGHDVGVTCLEAGGAIADELRAEGIRVTIVPAPGIRTMLHPAGLAAWLQDVRPDVVHVHTGAWLKGARAGRRVGGARVLHTIHGWLDDTRWYTPLLDWWAARSTDRVIAVSDALRDYLTNHVGLAAAQTGVIPNGIDADHFRPGPRRAKWRESLGIPSGAPVIGNVARLTPVKDHALLLAAFAVVRRQVNDATLVVVGDGPLRQRLEAQAAQLGLTQAIRFLGETREVSTLYREFDVFALSSRSEGTSISVLEAMASGVCVVATAVGGTPALLGAGYCGRLVPHGDPEALGAALVDLLHDQHTRARLAAVARDAVVAKYSLEAITTAYEREYGWTTHRDQMPLVGVS